MLYHAGLGGAGFVGVDVFFVISGYLITSLLLREKSSSGGIDLLAFYGRRVRRILPAAAVVILLVLLAAPFFLSGQESLRTANSAAAAAAFVANIFLQVTTGGYFDAAVDQMPLLHLWSLSVEEQFYFFWPALLLVLPRRWLLPTIVGLGLASFALAEWLMTTNPQAAFYQMPARFWELAAGGIIAAGPMKNLPRHAIPLGIVTVIAATLVPSSHFPGYGALPAVLGSCLIVAGVHGGGSNRFLASRPMVGIGLVSYSLYLWHVPILAFYRANTVGQGPLGIRLLLCVVAMGLAVLTFLFIEKPFRRLIWEPRRVVAAGAGMSVALIFVGAMVGYQTSSSLLFDSPRRTFASLTAKDILPTPEEISNPPVVVWGDSYAISWLPLGWAVNGGRRGVVVIQEGGCAPLLGYAVDNHLRDKCIAHNKASVARLRGSDTVILAFYWQIHPDLNRLESALESTLKELAPSVRRVIIIAPTPEMTDLVPKCILLDRECGVSRDSFELGAKPMRAMLYRGVAKYQNVSVVDPTEYLCTEAFCPGIRKGVSLYRDDHHLTGSAAIEVAQWVMRDHWPR